MKKVRAGAGNSCPYYKKCGGCQLQNMSYEEQLGYKERKVIGLLGRFGHVGAIVPMKEPETYRHKVQIAFAKLRNGRTISGVWQSSSGMVMATDKCLLDDPACDAVAVTIKRLIGELGLSVYDPYRGRGLVRFALIRKGWETDQLLLALGVGEERFPRQAEFVKRLRERHPEIKTAVLAVSKSEKNLVLGSKEKVLFGNGYVENQLCGCVFRMGASSFFQVNPEQTEKLYEKAIEFSGLSGSETVVDAYCGVGTIGIIASKRAKRVISVESNSHAVEFARQNVAINEAENVEVFCEDAAKFMTRLAKKGQSADTVFLDPPRAGCSGELVSSLLAMAPQKIVYISCNPETQARDMGLLTRGGYKVRRIVPVDMFPHTNHVETIIMMTKCGQREKINI